MAANINTASRTGSKRINKIVTPPHTYMKFLTTIILLSLFSCGSPDYNTKTVEKPRIKTITLYTIKIIFCDSRPPRIIETEIEHYHISTYKEAVPRWKNYLNVCEIQSISEREAYIQP